MKKCISLLLILVMTVSAIPTNASNVAAKTNYARLLQYSLYFYDANMCGTDAKKESAMTWRGNCHTYDAEMDTPWGKMDLSGGYHDAGDHIKFGLTASYTTMVLGLGYREFKQAYVKTGQEEHIKQILNRFAKYLRKCTVLDKDGSLKAYCYQVGDGRDHGFWGPPESQTKDTYSRVAYFITKDSPGTDQLMAAAGALASNYVNFRNPEDLKYAKALYAAAQAWPKNVRGDARDSDRFYRRYGEKHGTNGLWQDYGAAAAMWLHLGTNDITYKNDANKYIQEKGGQDYWPLSWDGVWQIVNALQGNADRLKSDLYHVKDTALSNPAEFVFVQQWGSNVLNAGLQFSGLLYDKISGNARYSAWAKGQTDYILGANPGKKCYITGYAANSVKHTHHCAASGHKTLPTHKETRAQKNVLVGALAGGPLDRSGTHHDVEDDYVGNEVGITYNAPFVGTVAALYLKYGNENMKTDTVIAGVEVVYPRKKP